MKLELPRLLGGGPGRRGQIAGQEAVSCLGGRIAVMEAVVIVLLL